ncbi:adhesin biosynthesis transcription regulatory family protein [Salmonella enterica]|uniref:adhesin biosynthesis transcription regulatory family protein n=1 Tax=Salmonella enterica TaxID=28901 RepID=UPI001E5BA025|nr:adhesin biosynthesis transcription regulatory family protein [Salmonella enterica]
MVLVPEKASENLFDIPIELSGIHGEKIINALRDYLVLDEVRKNMQTIWCQYRLF